MSFNFTQFIHYLIKYFDIKTAYYFFPGIVSAFLIPINYLIERPKNQFLKCSFLNYIQGISSVQNSITNILYIMNKRTDNRIKKKSWSKLNMNPKNCHVS